MSKGIKWFFILGITLGLVLPLGITFTAGAIASHYDCRLDEGSVHPCIVFGQDIGAVLYSMGMMAWIAVFALPLLIAAATIAAVAISISKILRAFKKSK